MYTLRPVGICSVGFLNRELLVKCKSYVKALLYLFEIRLALELIANMN